MVENTVKLTKVEGANDDKAGNSSAATAILPDKLCHPAPVEKPTGNIAITKTADPCVLKDDHWECGFGVKLQNVGAVDGTLPIAIDETVPDGLKVNFQAAPILKCEVPAGNVLHCELPALTAGASFSFAVYVDVPLDYVDKGTCKIPNTVKITSPVKGDAGDENTDEADDSSTATAKIDQVIPNPDPAGASWIIPCDPPALQIEKIADPQVCTKAPAGFECSYDVKVTSVGKDPYHGTLEIDEIIPVGSTLKSFSAPWKCAGAAPAAHCSHPFVDLAPGPPGEFRELKITIAVPDSFATSGQCAITNEVHTSVAAAVLHSDKAAQYMAKATAKIPADACGKPANVCPITQRMPNGGCCPDGERWNGRACTPLVAPKCPGGTTGTPPDCKPIVVKQCPAGSVGVYPDCRCPGGTRGTPPDCKPIVVKQCPAGSVGVYPDCRCPGGTRGTPPDCKPIVVKQCPAGSVGVYPDCRCPGGTRGTPPDCKPIVVKQCPAGSVGVYPDCRCPRRHARHTARL